MFKKFNRKATVAVVLGLILGVSGFAAAAFTTNVSPWAPGEVATAVHPEVIYGEVQAPLYPGYAEGVVIRVKNTNPVPVSVTSVSHVGYRNISDTAASHEGNATRLEDFLVNNLDDSSVVGTVINPGQTVNLVLPDAVGLESVADDARQGHTFESGYFVAFQLVPGNEVP